MFTEKVSTAVTLSVKSNEIENKEALGSEIELLEPASMQVKLNEPVDGALFAIRRTCGFSLSQHKKENIML